MLGGKGAQLRLSPLCCRAHCAPKEERRTRWLPRADVHASLATRLLAPREQQAAATVGHPSIDPCPDLCQGQTEAAQAEVRVMPRADAHPLNPHHQAPRAAAPSTPPPSTTAWSYSGADSTETGTPSTAGRCTPRVARATCKRNHDIFVISPCCMPDADPRTSSTADRCSLPL